MPTLHVETVSFRGSDPNALPLLVRQRPVTGPEWTRAGARQPAAIAVTAAGGHLRIGVTFSSPDLAGRTVNVLASRLDAAGRALQNIAPVPVTFDAAGVSGRVELRAAIARRVVEIGPVRWQWKVQDTAGTHDAAITEHRIAIVLGHSTSPWSTSTPAPAEHSHPWWEVIETACAIAGGTAEPDAAAARITRHAFEVWGGRFYEWNSGSETFASNSGDSPRAFDCARFLALVGGPTPSAREIVDCSDMAAIVSTFSAVLGCPMAQLTLWQGLNTRVMKLVGKADWEFGVGFPLHELGVSVPLAPDPQMWDGCLMISGDAVIGPRQPVVAMLPAGVGAAEYMQRLLSADRLTFGDHIRRGPLTRPVRPLADRLLTPQFDEHLDEVARSFGLDGPAPPQDRAVPRLDPIDIAGTHWPAIVDTPFPQDGAAAPEVDRVARLVYTFEGDPARRVRATIYLCRDADAARRRLIALLGSVTPRFERVNAGPGLAFVSPDRKTILGAWMNVAYRVSDMGQAANAVGLDARFLTGQLTERLGNAAQPL